MSKNGFWYGFLEAGSKSSGVLRDSDLDTGNKKTIFLFNLARERVLEYDRVHVEPRLRELTKKEQDMVNALEARYATAKSEFLSTRGGRRLEVPDTAPVVGRKAPRAIRDDGDFDGLDADLDEALEDEIDEES